MLVAFPSAIAFGVTIYAAIGPEYAGLGALAGILGTTAVGLIAPTLGADTLGTPYTGAPGIVETVDVIMAREALAPGLRTPGQPRVRRGAS